MPLHDEFEAARYAGYTWTEWEQLARQARVYAVAFWRVNILLDLHREDAVSEHMEMQRMARSH